MINSQNSSNLNISLSSTGANFNALDNNWFIAKINNNALVRVLDSNGQSVDVVLHGWEAMPSTAEGLILASDKIAGYGFVDTTIVNNEPKTIINPAVSLFNNEITEGTLVYMRLRSAHTKYSAIYECITMGSGSSGVKSVQCVNNILVVTY